MSVRHQDTSITGIGQSPGCDPKNSKRSSGLFSFFKWFKTSTSRESVSLELSSSSSCDSLNSTSSTGTIASFSFISPINYKTELTEKNIVPGPETDTYRARLKQRDKRRENDKNVTLRKKYNLFFNRDTIPKPTTNLLEEIDNSKSLPLMTKKNMKSEDEEKIHRRTNSESSKLKKAGAYCHVKGKRKAPPPPTTTKLTQEGTSTMSLRRKKRLAPQPPAVITPEKVFNSLEKIDDFENIEYADAEEVIFNDSLKLDHGVLKPVKLAEKTSNKSSSSIAEPPVSPRPWYKRSLNRDSGINFKKEKDNKYEPIELAPDKNCKSSKVTEKSNKKKEDKRKSGISFLTNISELDREASEIIKKENKGENEDFEPPPFMRPKHETIKTNSDSWITPKRKSAKDLIAKFNAITSVTKVTVNSAFFGTKESGVFQKENLKRDYFGISSAIKEEPFMHAKVFEFEDNKTKFIPLMKSESAVVKTNHSEKKEASPVKFDKKSWFCPKCLLENDYWRIICYVCATIKPYFDDLTSTPVKNTPLEKNKTENLEVKHFPTNTNSDLTKNTAQAKYNNNLPFFEKHLERSKTQIGFSALAKYNDNGSKEKKFLKSTSVEEKPKVPVVGGDKQDEKERLKKMLIEMKNSLPKKRFNCQEKNNNRTSVIDEKVEMKESKNVESDEVKITATMTKKEENDTRVAEVVIATSETIYENIKVKKTDNPKPIKISSSAQTSAVAQKEVIPPNILEAVNKKRGSESSFELLRPKDFANIYSVKTDKPEHHIYTNLMEDKQDFFNVALKFDEIKNSVANNTDTLEVNRLLKRLESAIGKGELTEASKLARDLAQLKVNCSVVRQKSIDNEKSRNAFTVNMYVEDKVSHRGPFPIQVTENQTVAQLKAQVENEFLIPAQVQRWILGKKLVADDGVSLKDLNVETEGCSIFLYLVAPANETKTEIENKLEHQPPEILNPQPSCSKIEEVPKIVNEDTNVASSSKEASKIIKEEEIKPNHHEVLKLEDNHEDFDSKTLKPDNKNWECIMCTFLNLQNNNICAICATVRRIPEQKIEVNEKPPEIVDEHKDEHYKELLNLDNADLVENIDPFECLICLSEIDRHEGVTLRDCLHQFCKPCLMHTIEFTDEAEIVCPYRDDQYSCDILLQDREIKALLTPEMYDQFLAKSIAQAENKMDKSFHCKTPDCRGWCIFEDNVNYFHCPVCRKVNCLTCQAIHMGANCKQYQESLLDIATDENSQKTKEMLAEMVNKGEAINCPTCQVILMKKWGCDWLRCSMCKTEICWVTRGPRWGPAGKGDTSGGCKCGVNGVKCHPQCNYCH